jgi:hypothetical protein
MIKSIAVNRTDEQIVELAKQYAPRDSQELLVLLRETLGDLERLEEWLRQPPQKADAGQVIADLYVQSTIVAHKSRQLAKALDKLLKKVPDDLLLPVD